jgi:hypothetical protein
MTDALKLLAYVANLQAEDCSDGLKKVADQQRDSIEKKKAIRAVQTRETQIAAEQTITPAELQGLLAMRQEIGSTQTSDALAGFTVGGDGKIHMEDSNDATQRKNKAAMDALKKEIDNKMDNTTDDAQALQFTIQTTTSDMQNAQSTASQAEKRVDDLRNEMRKNWAS